MQDETEPTQTENEQQQSHSPVETSQSESTTSDDKPSTDEKTSVTGSERENPAQVEPVAIQESATGDGVSQPTEDKPKRRRRKKTAPVEAVATPQDQVTQPADFTLDPIEPQDLPRTDELASQPKPQESAFITEDAMRLLLTTVFNGIATARGDHWKLSKDEQKTLVPPATRVANKYAPSTLGKYSDEFALAIAVVGIVWVRIDQDKKDIAAKKEAQTFVQPLVAPAPVEEKPILVQQKTIEQMYPTLVR